MHLDLQPARLPDASPLHGTPPPASAWENRAAGGVLPQCLEFRPGWGVGDGNPSPRGVTLLPLPSSLQSVV